jgi:hypothetical protein
MDMTPTAISFACPGVTLPVRQFVADALALELVWSTGEDDATPLYSVPTPQDLHAPENVTVTVVGSDAPAIFQ